MIFISHDFGFLSHVVDEYYVLYGGFICEHITDKKQFFNPENLHPYTQDLISSLKPKDNDDIIDELSASADFSKELKACPYYEECNFKNLNDKLNNLCHSKVPPIINTDSENKKIDLNLKWQRCWLRDE